MVDIKNSGYKVTAQTILSTELNSLADDTWLLSSEVDNTTNGYMFADFEIDLASITPTGTDAAFELYILPSVDGTQYPSVNFTSNAEEQENTQYYIASLSLSLTAEVHIHVYRGAELPAGKWKLGVRNRANVGLASSGSTVKWRPWQFSSA